MAPMGNRGRFGLGLGQMDKRYTIEVEAHYYSRTALDAVQQGAQEMVAEIHRAYNESLDRAALALLADGVAGLYAARDPNGGTSLCVGDMPAIGEYINNVACTVTIEWDGFAANVVTTWLPPYEHLNR